MRNLPSASNAALRSKCAGMWQLVELLEADGRLKRPETQAASDGTIIHWARETGSSDIPEDLIRTKELLDQMEASLVRSWGPDPDLLGRERRLYFRRGITPIHTGKFDYAYISADGRRMLVGDDKTGRLEVPEADINDQLRELAALVYFNYPEVDEITVAICQPWISREPSVAFYDRRDAELALLLLKKNLADIVDPHAIRTPGRHCSYCPAAPFCEENRLMVNAVISLADRIKKGDYQLPIGKWGTVFLDRAIMAKKVIEEILERYKDIVTTDPAAVPGYYLKAGATRKVVTNPFEVFQSLDLNIETFLRCGKFTLSPIVKAVAKARAYSVAEAEIDVMEKAGAFILKVENDPSLVHESPRRGKPKELKQAELLE